MKRLLIAFFLPLFLVSSAMAQTGKISGTVKDANTGETLIGATIQLKGTTTGTITDLDGNFTFDAQFGAATLVVSYIGFNTSEVVVNVSANTPRVNVSLKSVVLDEVMIVADFARTRETPVAFSNVLPAKLEEELAGRDIPMILNTTPGVYATQQGGGDGDARITIRGFNQRNIAVMLDGVPVNDMENGWVYWSNWFGLDMIQRQMQVQRGLGASRLGIPSVGGTINIITTGISNKPSGSVKQEITDFGYYRTSFGVSSGRIGNWGITAAGSYKWGSGWADMTDTKGFFYYLKMERRLGKHIISLTGFGAPQQHGQRGFMTSAMLLDSTYAYDALGIRLDSAEFSRYEAQGIPHSIGLRYNQHWGHLNRWTNNENGDVVPGEDTKQTEKLNFYHKPQFSLKDTWKINNDLFISTTLYLSVGNGGGTGITPSLTWGGRRDGLINFQGIYDGNYTNIDTAVDMRMSNFYLYARMNNHFWYGILSSAEYNVNESLNISGGIDLRSYRGIHYQEIYDLLGGDAWRHELGGRPRYNNQLTRRNRIVGDKEYYHNDGLVRWQGLFGQVEYNTPDWSGFFSASVSNSSYKRIDYFAPYVIGDRTINLRHWNTNEFRDYLTYYSDTVLIGGVPYYIGHPSVTRPSYETPWVSFIGYTLKGGFNYNLTERINAFINFGNLSKAPRFNNVFAGNTQNQAKNIKNEVVYAVELGSSYGSPKFSGNLNFYYTYWLNKPLDRIPSARNPETDETIYMNITGIAARHAGIEFDCIYKPIKELEIQGILSLGSWIYNTADSVPFIDDAGNIVEGIPAINYDARGIYVGDAAQTQFGGSVRYNFTKDLFVQGRWTHFARNYSNFNPENINYEEITNTAGEIVIRDNRGRQSWMAPSYSLFDLSAGYTYKFYGKYSAAINFNILNALNTMHITDAQNNYQYLEYGVPDNFDAKSAGVFMGMGRRYMLAMRVFF